MFMTTITSWSVGFFVVVPLVAWVCGSRIVQASERYSLPPRPVCLVWRRTIQARYTPCGRVAVKDDIRIVWAVFP